MPRIVFREPSGSPQVLIDVADSATPRTLAAFDVSKLPGARVVGSVGFDDASMRVSAACVRAPSDRFVTGIESVLYERATALALRTESLTPIELGTTQTSSDKTAGLFTERLEGRTSDRTIAVRHMLAFIGPDRDALLCTAVCSAPAAQSSLDCITTVTSLRIDGPHSPPPAPGIVTRALFFAADHPKPSLAAFALVTVMIVALILWRRPRNEMPDEENEQPPKRLEPGEKDLEEKNSPRLR